MRPAAALLLVLPLQCACGSHVVVPPSRFALGTGLSTSNARDTPARTRRDPSAAVDLRWTVHPLSLAQSVHFRRVDVGMGYGGTWAADDTHGPELLGEYFFWRESRWRAGLVGSAQVAMAKVEQRRVRGFGAALGIDLERAGFVSESHAHGEWALGGYTTVRRVSVDGLVVYTFLLGVEARVPLAGVP